MSPKTTDAQASLEQQIKHYIGIVVEEFQSRVSVIAESVQMLDEKMDRRFAGAEEVRKADFVFLCELCAKNESAIKAVHQDVKILKTDVAGLKTDVAGLKTDMVEVKQDLKVVRQDVAQVNRRLDEHDTALEALH